MIEHAVSFYKRTAPGAAGPPCEDEKKEAQGTASMKKQTCSGWAKKLLWPVLSLFIALASIGAVASQLHKESLSRLLRQLQTADPLFMTLAAVCMLGFILFEALALRATCSAFAPVPRVKKSCEWAAADIYFSAITPSATGGQPACLLLMRQDGIPAAAGTAALVMNLTMYTLSILVLGLGAFLLRPGLLLGFGLVSRVLIVAGYLVQIFLALFFYLLVRREQLLEAILAGALGLAAKLPVVKHHRPRFERLCARLEAKMAEYRLAAHRLTGHGRLLAKVFFYNLLQRASQIAVTVFVFLALGGTGAVSALDLFAVQSYVVLGSNYVPVPGGMGITDYLMLDGFGGLLPGPAAVGLELVSRSLSFYLCILLCGGALVLRWALAKKHKREESEK